MKSGCLAALLMASALAGCAGEAANPSLTAPKVVVQDKPDGNVTIFVHSAFGERVYDWISVSVDNRTLENRTLVFSWEGSIPQRAFFMDVRAGAQGQLYDLRATVALDVVQERATVAFLEPDGDWTEPREFGLPFERILDRRTPQ